MRLSARRLSGDFLRQRLRDDALTNFLAMDADVRRAFKSQPHNTAPDSQDANLNVLGDNHRFSDFAGKHQHQTSFPP